MEFTITSGTPNHVSSASSKIAYLYSTTNSGNDVVAATTGAQCIIATETAPAARRELAAANTHTILAATTGTCSNITASATPAIVVGTAWTASTYGFNCTAASAAAFQTLKCALYFDMGTTHIDMPAATSFKGGVHLLTSSQTAADVAASGAFADATLTKGTGDTACEDKSSATVTAFAGAAALVGSALFF